MRSFASDHRSRGIVPVALAVVVLAVGGCASTGGGQAPRAKGGRRPASLTATASLAGGDYEHDTVGSSLDGETSAGLFAFLFEANSGRGFGGGVSFEVLGSDDDLFADEGFEPAEVDSVLLAPFFSYHLRAGERFRMPVRVGPWFHFLELEDQVDSDTIDWSSVGVRFGIEPEIVVAHAGPFECSFFTSLSLGVGVTEIEVSAATADEDFESEAATFGLELGPRIRLGGFSAGLSLFHRGLSVDDSDPEGGVFVREIESTFSGVAVTLGARL